MPRPKNAASVCIRVIVPPVASGIGAGALAARTGIMRTNFKGATSMFGKAKVLALAGALAASTFIATGAQAAGWIVGLVDGKSIVTIDPATRKVASKVDVKGAGPARRHRRAAGRRHALRRRPGRHDRTPSTPSPAKPR